MNIVIIEIELLGYEVKNDDPRVKPILDEWGEGIKKSLMRNSNIKCNVKVYPKP